MRRSVLIALGLVLLTSVSAPAVQRVVVVENFTNVG